MDCDVRDLFSLAHRHRGFDRRLYDTVMRQDGRLVRNYATPESRRLYKMQRSVLCCLHLKKGFMRFRMSGHGILHAKTRLEHDVADLLLAHFHRRYPLFHIAVEDAGRTHVIDPAGRVISYDTGVDDIVRQLEARLPANPLLEGLDFDDRLWENYYDSQYIRERRNIKLMRRMMPLKHRDKDALETMKAGGCRKLKEYI